LIHLRYLENLRHFVCRLILHLPSLGPPLLGDAFEALAGQFAVDPSTQLYRVSEEFIGADIVIRANRPVSARTVALTKSSAMPMVNQGNKYLNRQAMDALMGT